MQMFGLKPYPVCFWCRASWPSSILALSSSPGNLVSSSAFPPSPGVCGWPPGLRAPPGTGGGVWTLRSSTNSSSSSPWRVWRFCSFFKTALWRKERRRLRLEAKSPSEVQTQPVQQHGERSNGRPFVFFESRISCLTTFCFQFKAASERTFHHTCFHTYVTSANLTPICFFFCLFDSYCPPRQDGKKKDQRFVLTVIN